MGFKLQDPKSNSKYSCNKFILNIFFINLVLIFKRKDVKKIKWDIIFSIPPLTICLFNEYIKQDYVNIAK